MTLLTDLTTNNIISYHIFILKRKIDAVMMQLIRFQFIIAHIIILFAMKAANRNQHGKQRPDKSQSAPRAIQSAKTSLNITSILKRANYKKDLYPGVISHSIAKRKNACLFQTINDRPPDRVLSENHRANRLYTLPDEPKSKAAGSEYLIRESQFSKNTALVQFYSNNVFGQAFKFKRFTGILKKKYSQQPDIAEHTRNVEKKETKNGKYRKSIANFELFREKQYCSREKECRQGLQPKLSLKRRPSSGIPMKKGEIVIKRRKNSLLEDSRSGSMEIKHIDALKFSQNSSTSPPSKARPIVNANCLCLKTTIPSSLQVRGQRYESIEPWQDEQEKVRLLTDLDITVKI